MSHEVALRRVFADAGAEVVGGALLLSSSQFLALARSLGVVRCTARLVWRDGSA